MNAIEFITQQMRNDSANPKSESIRLIAKYKSASKIEKAAMDDTMLCVCGWTIATIIDEVKAANKKGAKK